MSDIDEAGPSTTVNEKPQRPKSRQIYEFIIRACCRLESLNRTPCSAIMLMYRLKDSEIIKNICNYSLASACILVAAKLEEDNKVRLRDVVNVSHRILHPEEPYLEIDDLLWDLRKSLGRLEFVVLRELGYSTHIDHPHKYLAIYLDQLRSWMPQEFSQFAIAEEAYCVLRDCYVVPPLILDHSQESLAIAALSVVLKGHDINVPQVRDFYTVFSKHISESKLRRLEEEILEDVYKQKLK